MKRAQTKGKGRTCGRGGGKGREGKGRGGGEGGEKQPGREADRVSESEGVSHLFYVGDSPVKRQGGFVWCFAGQSPSYKGKIRKHKKKV